MRGKIRIAQRSLKCPKCGDDFRDAGRKGFHCLNCLTKPDRYYIDISFKGDRIRIFCDKQGNPLDSFERADNILAHINYEIDNHIFNPNNYRASDLAKYLFENAIEKWLESKDKDGIATVHKYRQFKRDYFIFFKGHDIRELRTSHIHDFNYQLPEHLSGKSKKNILGALHAFLKWLSDMEQIEKVPSFPKMEIEQPEWQWVDVDVQSSLLLAIPEEDRNIFIFLALHGCRPSEARALKVKDFDFSHNSITIRRTFSGKSSNILLERTKTKKQRVIPINLDMTGILKDLCRNRFGEDFVFLNPRTKEFYRKTAYQEIWDAARKQKGLTINSYEGLRHSFASQRACRGIGLYLIGKVLGHSDSRTTEKYSHTNLESLKQIMEIQNVTKPSSKVKNGSK